ncbi:hypothetical protein E2C01_077292 [Portunus trituberculatus]|uniref:Uncharacterized protein n=1 Tax=Portunus trituberculatus TaxID=210409 RepID=A0A5B7ILS8_PORTR|nr:hypothetical protein [Portunus trituberculatus]
MAETAHGSVTFLESVEFVVITTEAIHEERQPLARRVSQDTTKSRIFGRLVTAQSVKANTPVAL